MPLLVAIGLPGLGKGGRGNGKSNSDARCTRTGISTASSLLGCEPERSLAPKPIVPPPIVSDGLRPPGCIGPASTPSRSPATRRILGAVHDDVAPFPSPY